MKITYPERDYIILNEENLYSYKDSCKKHLIKLDFLAPTQEKVLEVLHTYPDTQRFIISKHIKFYNECLRATSKKYYIENAKDEGLITFFRKNNKCILNFANLKNSEKIYILEHILEDILHNTEVVMLHKDDFFEYKHKFISWPGNILICK